MSDDIVKYLRLSQTRFNRHAEAADEIERLQADLIRLETWALHALACPRYGKKICWDCCAPSVQDYLQAQGVV
jgi:hypothetical protein